MTPDLPGADVLDGVRKEIERNALRARNGIKWAAGGEFAQEDPTPNDVIWQRGRAYVRHYRREEPATYATPVLAFLGLVGQPYVFDLYPGGSIVQMLMERGFDAYVMHWGVPDAQDADNTLETYLQSYLPSALDAVCAEAGSQDMNMLAYCMGGCMAIHGLAARPDLPVNGLVTLASPFDFARLGPLIDALRTGDIEPETMLDDDGLLPGSIVRQSFKSRKPTGDLVQYANLWQNVWNDEYMEGFQAIGRFLNDHIPLPGATLRQVTDQWLRDNAFVNDTLRLDGRRAPLENVRNPVLGVIAERDDIVYEEATAPIEHILPNAQVDMLPVDAGHTSLFSGRKAVKKVMPLVFDWLSDHSEEAA